MAIPTSLLTPTGRVIKRNVGSREEKKDFSSGKDSFSVGGETRKGSVEKVRRNGAGGRGEREKKERPRDEESRGRGKEWKLVAAR